MKKTGLKPVLIKWIEKVGEMCCGERKAEIKSLIFDKLNLRYQWDIQSRCKLGCWKFQFGTQRREVG